MRNHAQDPRAVIPSGTDCLKDSFMLHTLKMIQ